jgi:hypothetical protein
MKKLIYILFIISMISCHTSKKLTKTKWEWKINEDCINYIVFNSNRSINLYYCEPDEIVYGKYALKGDTIFIQTISGQYDSEFPEDSQHRLIPSSYYLILKGNSIISNEMSEIKYERLNKKD